MVFFLKSVNLKVYDSLVSKLTVFEDFFEMCAKQNYNVLNERKLNELVEAS